MIATPQLLPRRSGGRTGRRTLLTFAHAFALALLSVLALPASLFGQDCDDPMNPDCNVPPYFSISPSGGYFSSASQTITIRWDDDNGDLIPNSRDIRLNGTPVTFDFVWLSTTEGRSTGTVNLAPGRNTLSVEICDEGGNCPTDSAVYYYDNANPV